MNKPSCYLGGIISGLSFKEANSWREYVQKKLAMYGIISASPLRGKDHLKDETVLHRAGYEKNPMSTQRGITTRDFFDVKNCDVILMNLLGAESVSIGCMLEVGASFILRKPIVCIIEEDNPHADHAMLNEAINYKTNNLEEAIEIVRKLLCYDL